MHDQPQQPKEKWQPMYTVVLVANLIYIILFYVLTTMFA